MCAQCCLSRGHCHEHSPLEKWPNPGPPGPGRVSLVFKFSSQPPLPVLFWTRFGPLQAQLLCRLPTPVSTPLQRGGLLLLAVAPAWRAGLAAGTSVGGGPPGLPCLICSWSWHGPLQSCNTVRAMPKGPFPVFSFSRLPGLRKTGVLRGGKGSSGYAGDRRLSEPRLTPSSPTGSIKCPWLPPAAAAPALQQEAGFCLRGSLASAVYLYTVPTPGTEGRRDPALGNGFTPAGQTQGLGSLWATSPNGSPCPVRTPVPTPRFRAVWFTACGSSWMAAGPEESWHVGERTVPRTGRGHLCTQGPRPPSCVLGSAGVPSGNSGRCPKLLALFAPC